MSLKPWYKVVTPREDLRDGKPLFGAARSEALKRFLVEDAAGSDQRFWSLPQALSALQPTTTDEKRWLDRVLARTKGFGFSIY